MKIKKLTTIYYIYIYNFVVNFSIFTADDGYLHHLRSVFLKRGKGRRPDLNIHPCTNRILLQMYKLKVDSASSWADVSKWMLQLYPGHNPRAFRGLIEKCFSTVLKAENLQIFLDTVHNLDYIGEICHSICITRKELLDPTLLPSFDVDTHLCSNALLIELHDFCTSNSFQSNFLHFIFQKLVRREHMIR